MDGYLNVLELGFIHDTNIFKESFVSQEMLEIDTSKIEWNYSGVEERDVSFEEQRKVWLSKAQEFVDKWKEREDFLEDPIVLKEALDDYEKFSSEFGAGANERYYYVLKTQKDQNSPELKAKYNSVEEFGKKIGNMLRFFELKIGKVKKELQSDFLNCSELKEYVHFLERAFELDKFSLGEKEENILSLKNPSSYSSWVDMVAGLLSKEERIVLNEKEEEEKVPFSELFGFMKSQKKSVRDKSAEALNDILKKYEDIAEAELNAVLANKKVDDRLRGFSRPDKSRHLDDDISSEVVDVLVKTVSDNFEIARNYYKLKAKLLGLEKLDYHERNAEYGNISKEYSYEESMNLVAQTFSNLDKRFYEIVKEFAEKGQVDVYPKKGKRSGAFCIHALASQPTFISLNHTNKLNDILTLAHEFGHAINGEFMKEKQNALNFDTPKSTAEVASTFMEDFVLEELMRGAEDEMKLALMMQKLDAEIATIMRQVACYKFEQELHKNFSDKGYLAKEEIGKLFQKHMAAYMGDFVEQSPGSENWWIYWPHIREFFYNYSYSSGLLISKAMQKKVKDNPEYIKQVKEFLATGVKDSPENIFNKMGIDITKKEFWETGLKEVGDLLDKTKELAEKLGKILL